MIKYEKGFFEALLSENPWWKTGQVPLATLYPKKRAVYKKLEPELSTKRILTVSGPRRVGKSVLLHQLIKTLIERGTPPHAITYYSMDDPAILAHADSPIQDIVDFAQNRSLENRTYVFLDEIQTNKGWHQWIKAYYDREARIKFILSGSSSLDIQTEANQYLRGRTVDIEVRPLDFIEFLEFIGTPPPDSNIQDPVGLLAAEKQIRPFIEEYLLVGGFPEWFDIRNETNARQRWLTHLLSDIPKKAIYEDVAVQFNIRNPKVIDLLLSLLALQQSKILSYETLNETVQLDRATLLNYLEFLKASYLVLEVPLFAPPKKQLKAMKKFLIADPGLRNSIVKQYDLTEENKGYQVENAVGIALSTRSEHLTYWRHQNHEVDYVADDVPIEVKYRNDIKDKDLRGLLKFLETEDKPIGIVITKNQTEEKSFGTKKIRFMPLWKFLVETKREAQATNESLKDAGGGI